MSAEDRLGVLILAGGAGRRLGADKATLPWGQTTLVRHVFEQFPPECVGRCVVIANEQNELGVRAVLPEHVAIVVNVDPRGEMISSVRLGVEALRVYDGPVCIHPVDVYAVSRELVTMLYQAWLADPQRIHLPAVQGSGAHPLIVPARFLPGIQFIPPGCGLNHLLRGRAADVVRHAWDDERLLRDLDTLEDYARNRPAPRSEE